KKAYPARNYDPHFAQFQHIRQTSKGGSSDSSKHALGPQTWSTKTRALFRGYFGRRGRKNKTKPENPAAWGSRRFSHSPFRARLRG
ncbi:unnamed protein product, partial [Gulo gulo]